MAPGVTAVLRASKPKGLQVSYLSFSGLTWLDWGLPSDETGKQRKIHWPFFLFPSVDSIPLQCGPAFGCCLVPLGYCFFVFGQEFKVVICRRVDPLGANPPLSEAANHSRLVIISLLSLSQPVLFVGGDLARFLGSGSKLGGFYNSRAGLLGL